MTQITGMHHVAIRTSRFDDSIRFYTEVLGLPQKAGWKREARAALIEVSPGSYIEIFERDEAEASGQPMILHFCLRTDDVDGMLARVRDAGAKVTVEPLETTLDTEIGPVTLRLAFFEGPDGEVIELMTSDRV